MRSRLITPVEKPLFVSKWYVVISKLFERVHLIRDCSKPILERKKVNTWPKFIHTYVHMHTHASNKNKGIQKFSSSLKEARQFQQSCQLLETSSKHSLKYFKGLYGDESSRSLAFHHLHHSFLGPAHHDIYLLLPG